MMGEEGRSAKRNKNPRETGPRCCVVGCRNRWGTDRQAGVRRSYYSFPQDEQRRARWAGNIPHDNWAPRKYDRICSDHFLFGKKTDNPDSPGYAPTLFSTREGQDLQDFSQHSPPPAPPERRKARRQTARKTSLVCFASGCRHRTQQDACEFFPFPAEKRIYWGKLCGKMTPPSLLRDRLCSCHFENGIPSTSPTIFTPPVARRSKASEPSQAVSRPKRAASKRMNYDEQNSDAGDLPVAEGLTTSVEVISMAQQKSLSEKLWLLRAEGALCDVILDVRDEPISAHRVILAACSPVLLSSLSSADANPDGGVCHMRFENCSYKACLSVLEYMYTGTVPGLTGPTREEFYVLADMWQLNTLEQLNALQMRRINSLCSGAETEAVKRMMNDDEDSEDSLISSVQDSEKVITPKTHTTPTLRTKRCKQSLMLKEEIRGRSFSKQGERLKSGDDQELLTEPSESAELSGDVLNPSEDAKSPSARTEVECMTDPKQNLEQSDTQRQHLDEEMEEGLQQIRKNKINTTNHDVVHSHMRNDVSKLLELNPDRKNIGSDSLIKKNKPSGDISVLNTTQQEKSVSLQGGKRTHILTVNTEDGNLLCFKLTKEDLPSHPVTDGGQADRDQTKSKSSLGKRRTNNSRELKLLTTKVKRSEKDGLCELAAAGSGDSGKPRKRPRRRVEGDKPCPLCTRICASQRRLTIHLNYSHKKQESLRCETCDLTFTLRNLLLAHNVENHYVEGMEMPVVYHCKHVGCDFKAYVRYTVCNHRQLVHDKKKREELVECEICGKFCQRDSLRKHRKYAHESHRNYKCEHCDKVYTTDIAMKAHKRKSHEPQEKMVCDICGHSCRFKYQLEEHLYKKHDVLRDDKKGFLCHFCEFRTVVRTRLRSHLKIKHVTTLEKEFGCHQCEERFVRESELLRHKKSAGCMRRSARDGAACGDGHTEPSPASSLTRSADEVRSTAHESRPVTAERHAWGAETKTGELPGTSSITGLTAGDGPVGSGISPLTVGDGPVGSGISPLTVGDGPVGSGISPLTVGDGPVGSGISPLTVGDGPVGSGISPLTVGDGPVGSGISPLTVGDGPVGSGISPLTAGDGSVGSGISPLTDGDGHRRDGVRAPVGSGISPGSQPRSPTDTGTGSRTQTQCYTSSLSHRPMSHAAIRSVAGSGSDKPNPVATRTISVVGDGNHTTRAIDTRTGLHDMGVTSRRSNTLESGFMNQSAVHVDARIGSCAEDHLTRPSDGTNLRTPGCGSDTETLVKNDSETQRVGASFTTATTGQYVGSVSGTRAEHNAGVVNETNGNKGESKTLQTSLSSELAHYNWDFLNTMYGGGLQ